jgi:hypothetical protein
MNGCRQRGLQSLYVIPSGVRAGQDVTGRLDRRTHVPDTRNVGAVTSALRADERRIVALARVIWQYVRCRALEQALEQRSGGRLHLN